MSENENHVTDYTTYIKVWLVLMVLMVVNITLMGIKSLPFAPAIVLAVAAVQAYIALNWFMHLKHDGRFLRWIVLGVFVLYAIVIIITFLDYKFR